MTIILRDKAALSAWRSAVPSDQRVGFVPTMGALHQGHVSLMQQAREAADIVIVSIFVNPLQFGPNEDLSRYPRPIEADIAKLEAAGIDALFLPSVEDMYPQGASTMVVENLVSGPLCGAMRPGHFNGVTTVVLKLFNLVQPHLAIFGQKDAQQCAVIERMVRDLDVPVEIRRGHIVREADAEFAQCLSRPRGPRRRTADPPEPACRRSRLSRRRDRCAGARRHRHGYTCAIPPHRAAILGRPRSRKPRRHRPRRIARRPAGRRRASGDHAAHRQYADWWGLVRFAVNPRG